MSPECLSLSDYSYLGDLTMWYEFAWEKWTAWIVVGPLIDHQYL